MFGDISKRSAALVVEMNFDTLVLLALEFADEFACELGDASARTPFHAGVAQYRRGAVPISHFQKNRNGRNDIASAELSVVCQTGSNGPLRATYATFARTDAGAGVVCWVATA